MKGSDVLHPVFQVDPEHQPRYLYNILQPLDRQLADVVLCKPGYMTFEKEGRAQPIHLAVQARKRSSDQTRSRLGVAVVPECEELQLIEEPCRQPPR